MREATGRSMSCGEDLAALAREVTRLHGGAAPSDASAGWRWPTRSRRYAVPLEPLLELLDGVAMDLEPVEMPGLRQLAQLLLPWWRAVSG